MAKFYISDSDDDIDEIVFVNIDGEEETIKNKDEDGCIDIIDSIGGSTIFHKKDIPKLIKALEKAQELWGDK